MNKKSRITITPDVDVFVTDGNGCCASANGDEIYNEDLELGPRFSFVVPGIEEWLRRYEQATDFAETTTDPSFNWRRWHHEGLCFAKAIRERLPRCFFLYYTPPYEDRSQTVAPVEIDERINELIESLRPEACNEASAPSFKDNIEFAVKRKENAVNVLFQINRLRAEITVPFDSLHGLRNWLEKIIHGEEAVSVLHLPGNKLCFFPQTVGSHPEMARLWVMKSGCGDACFEAYVHTKEFVKSLYFSLMTSLGFFIYKSIDNYPSAEERHAVWTPYNRLKSQIVEAFVTEEACAEENDSATPVNETFVMFPDYGGCVFWDTMGVGSGDAEELITISGPIRIDVPGLKRWAAFYDDPQEHLSFEDFWNEGWELAKKVRRQLPDNIDLFFMCLDPKQPGVPVDYDCTLPKILVPKTTAQ